MRPDWQLAGKPATTLQFTLEHVLVWHDEPQVITALDQKNTRYLGVATDDSDDGEIVRWVYAPITHLEFYALLGGGTTVREALTKDVVIVCDRRVDSGIVDAMWRVNDAAIPEHLRPTDDSFLPNSARSLLPVASDGEQLVIDGKGIQENLISFADLGSVVGQFQELWDALYGAIFLKPGKNKKRTKKIAESLLGDAVPVSTLLVADFMPGSFAIKFKAKEERVFAPVFAAYRKLVDLGSNETDLAKTLERHGATVSRSFTSYMTTINSRKLEVLTKSKSATSYVSPRKAARIVGYGVQTKMREVVIEAAQTTESPGVPFTADGYFSGYAYHAKSFEFVRLDDEHLFVGTIEDTVLTRTPLNRGLHLSSKVIYRAEIRPMRRGREVIYSLLAFWDASSPPPLPQGTVNINRQGTG